MNKDMFFNWRLLTISGIILIAFLAVIFKLISLKLISGDFLENEGNKRYVKYKNIESLRGSIFDRNNFPLAVSIANYDVYALKGFKKSDLLKLAENIEFDDFKIDEEFIVKTLIKKNVSIEKIKEIKKLNFRNFEIELRYSRHYPLGDQIAPLIGFYGTDGAQEGIEKSYDRVLSGISGKKKYYRNAKQEIFSKPIDVSEVVQGEDIHLTIDSTIQFFTYKYLVEGIKKNKAKSGSAIVLDNSSGEILAIASYPSYNPNHPQRKIQKNRALVESYEIGSVLKPIMISMALEKEIINPKELIKIPRRLDLENKIIVDSYYHTALSPQDIIAFSSQVGASKIAINLGYENLKRSYYNFGLTKPISINFPSSSFGYMDVKNQVSKQELASLGYGYGITVSPFQIASAYSIFANKGIKKDFILIKDNPINHEKAISEDTAKFIMDSLEKVVSNGTGKNAEVDGYSEGGKTGTVHKITNGTYAEDSYRASFIGISPLATKSLTIFVSIDEPGLNSYSGGAVAAPVFAKIAQSSLNYLGYFEDE